MENKLFVTISHPIRSVERGGLWHPCSHADMPFINKFDDSFSTRFSMAFFKFFVLTFKLSYHFRFF